MTHHSPAISVIVANWNGDEWIARALSSLQFSARGTGRAVELIVVDDASTDRSCALIAERFPRVRLLHNPRNVGFRRTINRGVRAARGRVVVLCNNDLVAQEPFLPMLTRWFFGDRAVPAADALTGPLFAVSARTLAWYDGTPNQVCMGARWIGGRITPAWSAPESPAPCLFTQAGAAAYDRARFLELGGLSGLYEPAYWEDYDLSWRAARRGWRQVYDPEAVALHVGGGSMVRRFGERRVHLFKQRNHLLFEWRHLRSLPLEMEHAARLPLTLARSFQRESNPVFAEAFRGAVRRLPTVLRERMDEGRTNHLDDQQLLEPWRDFTPSL